MLLIRHISWGQFAVSALALTLLYYGWLGWRYYRKELQTLFTKQKTEPAAAEQPPQLVAASKADEGFSQLDSEDLVFAEEPEQAVQQPQPAVKNNAVLERIKHDQRQAALLGSVADLMEETRQLLASAQQAGESKERVLELLTLLAPGLQELEGTTYPDALRLFLYDEISKRFDFPLTHDELLPLWQPITKSHSPKKLKV